jgi:hypothetical protein
LFFPLSPAFVDGIISEEKIHVKIMMNDVSSAPIGDFENILSFPSEEK